MVWVNQYKRKYGPFDIERSHHKRAHSSSSLDSASEQRELKSPYLKFEATNHEFRPVFSEFRRFPKLFFGGRAGQSPFFLPDSIVKQIRTVDKVGLPKAQSTPKVVKEPKKVVKAPQIQSGYCEICECPFSELEEHLGSKVHKSRVRLNDLWSKLDSCINEVNKLSDEDSDLEVRVATSDQ